MMVSKGAVIFDNKGQPVGIATEDGEIENVAQNQESTMLNKLKDHILNENWMALCETDQIILKQARATAFKAGWEAHEKTLSQAQQEGYNDTMNEPWKAVNVNNLIEECIYEYRNKDVIHAMLVLRDKIRDAQTTK